MYLMGIVRLNQHYYYNMLLKDVKLLKERYGKKIRINTIGRTIEGRFILSFFVGEGNTKVLLSGGVHGRESNNPIVLMYMMEKFLENPNTAYTICFVPLLNPDGYVIATEGFHKMKNKKLRGKAEKEGKSFYQWKENARGIDINRNFPSKSWKKKLPDDIAGSERETKAFMKLCEKNHFDLYLDFHSRGEEIYYYRHNMCEIYNKKQRALAEIIKEKSGYRIVEPKREFDIETGGGNTVHYVSEKFGIPSFTIETMEEESGFPQDIGLQVNIYRQIKDIPFIYMLA